MITLHYTGTNTALSAAVTKANEILSGDAFYEKIASLPQTNTLGTSATDLSSLLKETNRVILVHSYRNPFGKVTKHITPFMFYVNLSKLSSVTAFAVHTLIHNVTLSIDTCEKDLSKKRKKYNFEEENSLPWKIGEIAEIISRKSKRFA